MNYQPYRNFVRTAGRIRAPTTDKVIKHFVCQARRSGIYLADKDVYTKRLWLAIFFLTILVLPCPLLPGTTQDPNMNYLLFKFVQEATLFIIIVICCFYIVIEDP